MRTAGFAAYVKSALKRFVDALGVALEMKVPQTPVLKRNWTDEQKQLLEQFFRDRALVEEFFNAMDIDTRRMCEMQLCGHTMKQIADEFQLPADSLSERYMDGVRTALDKVFRIQRDRGKDEQMPS